MKKFNYLPVQLRRKIGVRSSFLTDYKFSNQTRENRRAENLAPLIRNIASIQPQK